MSSLIDKTSVPFRELVPISTSTHVASGTSFKPDELTNEETNISQEIQSALREIQFVTNANEDTKMEHCCRQSVLLTALLSIHQSSNQLWHPDFQVLIKNAEHNGE